MTTKKVLFISPEQKKAVKKLCKKHTVKDAPFLTIIPTIRKKEFKTANGYITADFLKIEHNDCPVRISEFLSGIKKLKIDLNSKWNCLVEE